MLTVRATFNFNCNEDLDLGYIAQAVNRPVSYGRCPGLVPGQVTWDL